MSLESNPATYIGKPCKNGHNGLRHSSNRSCVECMRVGTLKRYHENMASIRAQQKEYHKRTWVKRSAKQSERRTDDPKVAEYQRLYAAKNRAKKNAHDAKRHAAKLRATPTWADLEAIAQFYRNASDLTRETGIPHHVDHIYPLQGETMCGLHVHTNLQVLTATENIRKHNRVV